MIKICGLKKQYNDIIFQNVDLEIEKGEAVVIIGGSGCGKSTLLRCINRLVVPEEGSIFIEGEDILAPNADVAKIRKKLGMVYQSFNLFSHLNVMENMILAPMKVMGLSKAEAIAQAEELLSIVGMENRKYHMPSSLSGGQKQRAAIARALAMKPEIMLFDEPTSALDPTMVDEVEGVIRRLNQSGMTCVIVTHEMRFAKSIASKVVFLAEKGIYEYGTAEQIFENPSRELTRQFLYRSRMLERKITRDSTDLYALCSEIRAFAQPYGYTQRQAHGMDFICDEFILSLFGSGDPKADDITLRFVADENGDVHTLLLEFHNMTADPLKHKALDELNMVLLSQFTKSFESAQNKDGAWEVKFLI